MSCCLYWVILEERLSVRVLASARYKYNNGNKGWKKAHVITIMKLGFT